ncbi:MAG: alanine racemase [Rhodocyclales bacterium]|nr:alanine racemase [Rhodocyclales bacterium]CAG0979122.1 diaminopimelate decarboxylase [Rhodocyclaceae bacterium]
MKQRTPWSKPVLTPHRPGGMNKFGALRPQLHQSELDGVAIPPLLEQYGSPLFIVSEKRLRENARHLRRAFSTRWPKVRHGWSYKTNYLGAICNVLHQEGSWAEVVSELEYRKARALGVPGSRIIFNGPWKPAAALEQALLEGAALHLDHLDELFAVEQIAQRLGRQVPVGLRMNFDTGHTEPWSRFGFNYESGAAMDAARRIGASQWLQLTGLHSHIGTFILDVRAYAQQARIMAEFMEAAERETGCRIEYLDIGGGFASRNSLQGLYLPPDQTVPSFEQYAEAIVTALAEATRGRAALGKPVPALVLETGRALVDDAEVLVTRVVGGKRLPDGRRAAILDAGVNLLFTAYWYNHDVRPLQPVEGLAEETVLYGPLCMNIDTVRASVMLPPLNVGDALLISPAGAYNNTQWMQFIQSRPAVVMVMQDGSIEPIRLAETLQTLTELERVPDALHAPFPNPTPSR